MILQLTLIAIVLHELFQTCLIQNFQIRGKDLAGAIKVMPMGLDAAIKKRVSGEFKSEVSAPNHLNSTPKT